MTTERSAAGRAAAYLGIVTDKPKPRLGSGAWWRGALLIATMSTVAVVAVNRL